MITTEQIRVPKKLPFDSDYVEKFFEEKGLDVLRWAVVDVTEEEFVIDAAVFA
ncbi:MAG: hypothetical protein K6C94_08830 [Candidatus Gastranaerophilales bacterium]|nr:hypothetical protein [Candidatus Gastranaerophilales bacterium]